MADHTPPVLLEARVTLLEQEQAQFAARLAAWDTRLERQQFLNEAAQRRHADALDRHEAQMARLAQIQEDQQRQLTALADLQAGHQDRMDRLEGLIQAITDLLDRGNGH